MSLLGAVGRVIIKPLRTAVREARNPSPTLATVNISRRTFVLGMLAAGVSACAVDVVPTLQDPTKGVNVSPNSAAGKGAMQLPLDQLFSISGTGERYLEKPLDIIPVDLYGEGLSDVKGLTLVIESDSSLFEKSDFPNIPGDYNLDLPCMSGMLNTTTTNPNIFNSQPDSPLPISVVNFEITDKSTGKQIASLTDSKPSVIGAICSGLDGNKMLNKSGDPIRIPIDPEFYKLSRLNITIKLVFQVDATNAGPAVNYLTYLRIKLVAEG